MANKFSNGLVKGYKKDKAEEAHQEKLRKEYKIEDEKIKVVEQKTTFKFIVNLFINLVKLLFTIGILILATVGLICLIYPEPREEFLIILQDIIELAKDFLGLM